MTLYREKNETILNLYHNFLQDLDIENFKEGLIRFTMTSGSRRHSSYNNLLETRDTLGRPYTRKGDSDHQIRPSTARFQLPTSRQNDRPRTSRTQERDLNDGSRQERRTYQQFIQVVVDMESQGFLDQRDLGIIKVLILRENAEVLREFDNYFLYNYSLTELGLRLQGLADKLGSFIERPTSPIPRKNEIMRIVNSVVTENLQDQQDLLILNKLIADENEFVFSTFDVFQSDRDQEDLLDSLNRIIEKMKNSPLQSQQVGNNYFSNIIEAEQNNRYLDRTINYETMWEIITEYDICFDFNDEWVGTLIALTHLESSAVKAAFQRFCQDQNGESLKLCLQVICNTYFNIYLHQSFSACQVEFILKASNIMNSEITAIFHNYRSDGKTELLTKSLKQVLDQYSIPQFIPRRKVDWEMILQFVESEINEEKSIYQSMQQLIKSSSQLALYQTTILELYRTQHTDLLMELLAFNYHHDLEVSQIKILAILQNQNPSETLIQIASSAFSVNQVRKFEMMYQSGSSVIAAALEVFSYTQDTEDFIDTLTVINSLDQDSVRNYEEEFIDFVNQKFSGYSRDCIISLWEEGDSRIKAALDVHDMQSDEKELTKVLSFIIKDLEA